MISKHILVPTVLILFISGLPAQQVARDYEPSHLDPVTGAMGRSQVIGDAGPLSLFSNPAQLIQHQNFQVRFSAAVGLPSLTNGHLDQFSEPGTDAAMHTSLLNLAAIYPSPDSDFSDQEMVFALGWARLNDWLGDYSWSYSDGEGSHRREYTSSNGINGLALGFAMRYFQRYSFGAGVQWVPEADFYTQDILYLNDALVTGTSTRYTSKMAFRFILGAHAALGERFSVALSFQPGFDWIAGAYWDEGIQHDGELILYHAPMKIGFGSAWHITPSVLLQYETQFYAYQDMMIMETETDLENGLAHRLGLEVGSKTRFRGGFALEPLPIHDVGAATPASQLSITYGAGMPVGPATIDLGMEHYSWSHTTNRLPFVEGSVTPYEMTYKGTRLALSVDLPLDSFLQR